MHGLVKAKKAENLIAYERGCNEVINASSIDEVKEIRDKVDALARYWRQRKDDAMEAAMSAIRVRADYEIGVISKALDGEHGGDRRSSSAERNLKETKSDVLKRAKIPFQRAAENEKLTKILTPKQIDALCRAAVEKHVVAKSSKAYLLQWKDDQSKAAFRKIKSRLPPGLHVGDFREKAQVIPNESVDLVFTDPPYDRESIPLYEVAAKEAARILKPGGSMVCYCGHLILPNVLPLMMAHLNYFWIGAHVHDGGAMSRMQQFGIIAGFKPLLWFVKGEKRADRQTLVCDTVRVQREKDTHPWQQAVAVADHFISGLTSPDGLVVDFFAGGGTTIVAAKKLKRPWVAFEIDKAAVARMAKRIG